MKKCSNCASGCWNVPKEEASCQDCEGFSEWEPRECDCGPGSNVVTGADLEEREDTE